MTDAHCELCGIDDGGAPSLRTCVSAPLGDGSGDLLDLPLRLHEATGDLRGTVLLLHGASAASRTFLFPRPLKTADGEVRRDLVGHLQQAGFDVWLLDWRGGCRVTEKYEPKYRGDKAKTAAFNLDEIARHDIPLALEEIVKRRDQAREREPIHVIGHCVGGGVLAMAIGAGHIDREKVPLGTVVLSTLGLFTTVPWDGWTKASDQALERSHFDQQETFAIHPDTDKHPWPRLLQEAYEVWPQQLLPEDNEVFRRVTFMFGRPFLGKLVPRHITKREELLRQFGGMALAQYIQLGQWVRRGFVSSYGEYSPPTGAISNDEGAPRDVTDVYLNLEQFAGLDIVLMTGEHNMLWHADSIHKMYDWLQQADCHSVTRHVIRDYAHQDMFWGSNAHRDLFPMLVEALS